MPEAILQSRVIILQNGMGMPGALLVMEWSLIRLELQWKRLHLTTMALFMREVGKGIAKYEGSWKSLGSGLIADRPYATGLICDRFNNIIVSGNFDTVNGLAVKNIASWDGTEWHTFGKQQISACAFALDNSGNLFTGASSQLLKWNDKDEWVKLGTGKPYSSLSVRIEDILVVDSTIFISGIFGSFENVYSPGIIKCNFSYSDLPFSNLKSFSKQPASNINCRVKNKTVFFNNTNNCDRISVHSISGREILRQDNAANISINNLSNQPLVFLIKRDGKTIWKKLLMIMD